MLINDYPRSFPIKKAEEECSGVKTFLIDAEVDISPGQFVMVWIPGYDEKPFAVTSTKKGIAITVKKYGEFTEKLFSLKKGDLLGVRGPYGKGFSFGNVKKACIVSGGIGIAALIRLAEWLHAAGSQVDFACGFKCSEEILFKKRLEKISKMHIATDDGSCGIKGYCTQLLENLLAKKKYDMLYCCGPEGMMKAVLRLCNKHNVQAQFAVERYMKCGIGICGHCALDDKLCCVDGPVFSREQLNKFREFGKVWHEKTGKKAKV